MRSAFWLLLTASLPLIKVFAQVGDGSELDRSAPPGHWKIPAAPVRTPAESMKLFDLPPEFRVELVAAEPLVQDPISMYFDERGRIWMLEWPSYNRLLRGVIPGLEKLDPPMSRVVILEDTDGDGRMDRRTVFMDGFDWPRGLQLLKDGALVLRLPEIVFAHDTDGNGNADQEEILVNGLEIPANPHGAQSNLFRAMDNWIYGSKFPRRMRQAGGTWTSQSNLSMRGQWGLSHDNYGRFIYASNTDHLRGDLVPGHYYTRNPNYTITAGVDVRYPQDQTVWPHAATPGVNRRGQVREENGTLQTFTANTAPVVYRGNQFPPEFVGNVFLGDVAGRLIRRSVLTEKEGMITAENAYSKREFLFSHDERFRPVFTANGPDGALYVTDMYRGIIEGHLFITSYLRQQIIERGLQQSFLGMGRIYRIVHQGRAPGAVPRAGRNEPAAWVEHLAHPNGFWRDTAQRLVVESGDRRVVPTVRKIALEHPEELARLHALWTLEGLDAVNPEILTRALADRSPHIRKAAIRLSEPFLHEPAFAGKVLALAGDERIEVRRQLLFSSGEGKGGAFEQAMVRLLHRDAAQPVMVEAALSGLRDREYRFFELLLSDSSWNEERPGFARLFGALAHAVINSGRQDDLERLLTQISDSAARPLWTRLAVLEGLADAKKRGLAHVPVALGALGKSAQAAVRARADTLGKAWTAPVPAAATPAPRSRRAVAGFDKGQSLFAICSACHGIDGGGQSTIAPPLTESLVVAGPADEMIRSVINGRNQDRKNQAYPDMPPLGGLGDEDIAAVVSYVRARWAGQTQPVTGADVRRVRDAGAAAAPMRK
ncbi:MAG: c-type cytochrome [Verrucomicrobia bacterium]|nr:c-type cytochrome [Verrucomicrobiota bacterium]